MLKQQQRSSASSPFVSRASANAAASGIAGASAAQPEVTYPALAPYPSLLSFYPVAPAHCLTIREFESAALDRLRVLRALETAHIRFGGANQETNINRFLQPIIEANLPFTRNARIRHVGVDKVVQERRKDQVGHWILKLAFSRGGSDSDEARWWIRQETRLFSYRWSIEELSERDRFIKSLDWSILNISPVPPKDKDAVREPLKQTYNLTDEDVDRLSFYTVPFTQLLDLVARRSVYIQAGLAYVSDRDHLHLLLTAYKQLLTAQVDLACKALPQLDEDDRILPILSSLAKQHVSKAYSPSVTGDQITHTQVDTLAHNGTFPPCMVNIHNQLRRDGHLKHMGRLTYGLFLKGTGLPLQEALLFWQKAFTKINEDQFQKQYAYNVRYNYGLEGKRMDYSPYSCMKLITGSGQNADHGCPFKYFPPDQLRQLISTYSAGGEAVMTEVVRMAREGHYQVACGRLLEGTKGAVHQLAKERFDNEKNKADDPAQGESERWEGAVEHPNQWADMMRGTKSRRVTRDRTAPTNESGRPVDVDEELEDEMDIDR
ncbi:DNA primase large subunit [Gaertneriomyces sp. JEL0708]|nr:DNA primase large subunit [Gaertneriomyces sp. JEL0708]